MEEECQKEDNASPPPPPHPTPLVSHTQDKEMLYARLM